MHYGESTKFQFTLSMNMISKIKSSVNKRKIKNILRMRKVKNTNFSKRKLKNNFQNDFKHERFTTIT